MLNNKDIDFYNKNGYLIISDKRLLILKKKIYLEFRIVLNKILSLNNIDPYEGENFEKLINYAAKFDKKYSIFSSCYDLLPGLLTVNNLSNNNLFIESAKKIGLKNPIIGSLPQIRIDRPKDKIRKTLLHQDIWYSFLSNNSVTIWFSLVKLSNSLGPLKLYPKTHILGIQKFKDLNKGTFSAIFNKKNLKKINAILKDDQFIIFSQYLLHESGNNFSSKPRISVQIRYNDIQTLDKPFSSFKSITSNFVTREQIKYKI